MVTTRGYPPIVQPVAHQPNLGDYETAIASFDWTAARNQFVGERSNIAYQAVDRHAFLAPDRTAIRWLGKSGGSRAISYLELAQAASRFASSLEDLVGGGRVNMFTLSPRLPAVHISVLGSLKQGSVASPLFSAFGPEPILTRLKAGDARVLVTTDLLYKRKVASLRPSHLDLEHVIVVDTGHGGAPDGTIDFEDFLARGDADYPTRPMDPGDTALIHFTSGTTGPPKGAIHAHGAVLHHHFSGFYALDLQPEDTYWCTADPGWVTGTTYGIISPLTNGVTSLVDEAEFDADRWYRNVDEHRVNVWYTSPTAIRMLMKTGADIAARYDLSSLRLVASVGEPLNAEAVVWGQEVFGVPVYDNWWQTETGGIMIANYMGTEIRPGSMGRPLPGIETTILRRDQTGRLITDSSGEPVEETEPFTEGELAVRKGWPSMFRGYLGMEERYRNSFAGSWYLSGDLAERDPDGYYWFVGRADDLIKSSGHLIGPFEVESALMEHPAVVEAGVIGKPDPVAGEVVKAFVSLNPGYEWSDDLARELMAWARTRLGPSIAPREIVFEPDLPRTRSGKIMRRLLKAWELGLPTGDTSSLEGSDDT